MEPEAVPRVVHTAWWWQHVQSLPTGPVYQWPCGDLVAKELNLCSGGCPAVISLYNRFKLFTSDRNLKKLFLVPLHSPSLKRVIRSEFVTGVHSHLVSVVTVVWMQPGLGMGLSSHVSMDTSRVCVFCTLAQTFMLLLPSHRPEGGVSSAL